MICDPSVWTAREPPRPGSSTCPSSSSSRQEPIRRHRRPPPVRQRRRSRSNRRRSPERLVSGTVRREPLLHSLDASAQTQEALERLDELLAAEVVDPYVYELLRELPPDIAHDRP